MLKRNEELLVKAGFEITKRDPKINVIAQVDQQDHFSSLAADCLAKKAKQLYVVVTKQGQEVFDINEENTRKKLIEFSTVFGSLPIILIESETGLLHKISFRYVEERGDYFMKTFGRLFVAAVIIGIIWLLLYLKII